jgi:hypothetical protein
MYHGSLKVCAAPLPCTTRLVCSFFSTNFLYTDLILERRFALGFGGSSDSSPRTTTPSIPSVLNSPKPTEPQLRINTQLSSASSTNQRTMSMETHPQEDRRLRSWASILSPTRMRVDSPVSRLQCDGWCDYNSVTCANVVGIINSPFSWWAIFNDILWSLRARCPYQPALILNELGRDHVVRSRWCCATSLVSLTSWPLYLADSYGRNKPPSIVP